jgi:hypothetical protein
MRWKRLAGFGLLVFPLTLIGFFLHEFGHWLAGELLGYEMWMTLNGASNRGADVVVPRLHQLAITGAGPAVTLLLGFLGWTITRPGAVFGPALVFVSFFMRLTAYAVSVFVNPNDEARLGLWLGVGVHPIHLLTTGGLLVLTVLAFRKAGLGWLTGFVASLLSAASVAAIVLFLTPLTGRLL